VRGVPQDPALLHLQLAQISDRLDTVFTPDAAIDYARSVGIHEHRMVRTVERWRSRAPRAVIVRKRGP
jgi:hypothetical protein